MFNMFLVGGFLSEDQLQIGISIMSVGILTLSRFPCKKPVRKTTRFHKMENKPDEETEIGPDDEL